jgi:hypothetical protein
MFYSFRARIYGDLAFLYGGLKQMYISSFEVWNGRDEI